MKGMRNRISVLFPGPGEERGILLRQNNIKLIISFFPEDFLSSQKSSQLIVFKPIARKAERLLG
jgi:hypothetical protein